MRTGRPFRPRRSCPGPEELAAFADGRLQASVRRELEAHVADCDDCLADLGLLARAADAPAPPVPEALLRRVPSPHVPYAWYTRRRMGAAAAAAVLVAAGGLFLQQRRIVVLPAAGAPEMRGLAATEVRLIEPGEGATFAADRGEVRWVPVPRTLYYEIRLTDLDGTLAWEGRTDASEILIPADVLRSFSSGFLWVTAYQPDNRSVRSRAMAVSVAPRKS